VSFVSWFRLSVNTCFFMNHLSKGQIPLPKNDVWNGDRGVNVVEA